MVMSKASLSSFIILCAALSACSDADTNRTMTGPTARPTFSEAPTDLRGGATVDGPLDVTFAPAAPSTQMAASAQAASGGRASGHVAFTFSPPWFNVASEEYSFVA